VTFRMSLDSSILILHLSGDFHQEAVLAAMERLEALGAELTLPLLCYAEVWTGVELLDEAEQQQQSGDAIHQLLQASHIQLVADNVEIAREAARAQADYRRRGGRREALIPDFVIGASASYYSGRLLTTNPRDFFHAFPTLEVLMPSVFVERYRAPDNDPENGQM
jgi:predicted nucleic acid-binding protein